MCYNAAIRSKCVNEDMFDMTGWRGEDFLDTDAENPVEDDPWADSTDNFTLGGADNSMYPQPAEPIMQAQSRTDAAQDFTPDTQSFSDVVAKESSRDAYEASETEAGMVDKAADIEADQEPSDSDIWNLEYTHSNEDFKVDDEYDEPEPLAEYDEDLSEPVYVSDADDADIRIAVRIDEFIASVDAVSGEQRNRIAELLDDLGPTQLRHWLQWLDRYSWTADNLILFLEFRSIWEGSSNLWEYRFWWARYGDWWSYHSKSQLSRDNMRHLVQLRLHCSPEEVIAEAWFTDWEDFEMWKRGFPSFATFALFRAELADSENWQNSLNTYETNAQDDADSSNPYTPFNQSELKKCWFAIQDWYDPSEWHDNLGWPEIWISGTSAYSTDTDASALHMWAPDMSSYFSDSEEEEADSAK